MCLLPTAPNTCKDCSLSLVMPFHGLCPFIGRALLLTLGQQLMLTFFQLLFYYISKHLLAPPASCSV